MGLLNVGLLHLDQVCVFFAFILLIFTPQIICYDLSAVSLQLWAESNDSLLNRQSTLIDNQEEDLLLVFDWRADRFNVAASILNDLLDF